MILFPLIKPNRWAMQWMFEVFKRIGKQENESGSDSGKSVNGTIFDGDGEYAYIWQRLVWNALELPSFLVGITIGFENRTYTIPENDGPVEVPTV